MDPIAGRPRSDDRPPRNPYLDVDFLAIRGLGGAAPLTAVDEPLEAPRRTIGELRRLRTVVTVRLGTGLILMAAGTIVVFGIGPASLLLVVGLGLLLIGMVVVVSDLLVLVRLHRAIRIVRYESTSAAGS